MKQTELVNVGLDYLRLTADDENEKASLLAASEIILLQDAKLGYTPRPGGQIGFYGRRGRHCFFGKRNEWAMLQVSGFACRDNFNTLLRQRSRATRLDIQVTLRIPGGIDALMVLCKTSSINARPGNGKKWKTKSIDEDGRIQTIYIGKRASEWFGRIYDKYAESGDEAYKDCVRFEIEIKGQAARDVWTQMKESNRPHAFCNTVVIEWFARHGITIENHLLQENVPDIPRREKPSEDKKVAWLANMVSGTVAYLCGTGHFWPVFNALFKKGLTECERSGILLSMALIEGSYS
jgi:hypothetical protein